LSINSHQTTADSHLQKDGRRYVAHKFTDHLGNDRTVHRKVDGAWTETEYLAQRTGMIEGQESQLADIEISEFIEQVKTGINPFRDGNNDPISPKHQTRNLAIKKVLRIIGNAKGQDVLEFKAGFSFLVNLTQAQVEGLGFSWARYQSWKTKVEALKVADDAHDTLEAS